MKQSWKPGNMLYPLPAVLVTCKYQDNINIFTVAWTGTICTNPPMVYISVRPERYSYELIEKSKVFTINLTTKKLVKATDYCGVRSGRNVDKFKEMNLETTPAIKIDCPVLKDSPVNIECKVKDILKEFEKLNKKEDAKSIAEKIYNTSSINFYVKNVKEFLI